MQEQILTLEEAADRAKVRVKSMREWLRTGKLKGIKAGRLWRVRASDLEAFFEASVQRPRLVRAPEADDGPALKTSPAPLPIVPTPQQRKAELIVRLQAMEVQGLSHQAMAQQFNAEGVPTLSGRGRWQAGTIGKWLAEAKEG